MATLTVTAKGQITLKKKVLEHLGAKPGDELEVELLPSGRLEIVAKKERPSGSLEEFFGSLPNERAIHLTLGEIQEATKASWAGEASDDDR